MDLALLAGTAAAVGFLHTLVGPDHYLPFIALGRARGWSGGRTLGITALCGAGHVLGSVALGAAGIALGVAASRLDALEAARGELAAWLLIAVGLVYGVWGLRRAGRPAHRHPLSGAGAAPAGGHRRPVEATPWVLFLVFVLGPCEPLIPLLIVPAAQGRPAGAVLVAGVFGATTLATMVGAVALGRLGAGLLPHGRLERYGHALAGASILLCGLGIRLLAI
jgi:sulfite exporter TauE/SafE